VTGQLKGHEAQKLSRKEDHTGRCSSEEVAQLELWRKQSNVVALYVGQQQSV